VSQAIDGGGDDGDAQPARRAAAPTSSASGVVAVIFRFFHAPHSSSAVTTVSWASSASSSASKRVIFDASLYQASTTARPGQDQDQASQQEAAPKCHLSFFVSPNVGHDVVVVGVVVDDDVVDDEIGGTFLGVLRLGRVFRVP